MCDPDGSLHQMLDAEHIESGNRKEFRPGWQRGPMPDADHIGPGNGRDVKISRYPAAWLGIGSLKT